MKITKFPYLLIACMALLVSEFSFAEEPQPVQNSAPTWQNSPDLPVGSSGQQGYEQIQESQVICRFVPNLLECGAQQETSVWVNKPYESTQLMSIEDFNADPQHETYSEVEYEAPDQTLALDPIAVKSGINKLILVCDNQYGLEKPTKVGNFEITGGPKDFEWCPSSKEDALSEAITIISPNLNPYGHGYNGGNYDEEELRFDLTHFNCLKPYLAQGIEAAVAGTSKYWFAQVTFNVDKSELKTTGPLHFEACLSADNLLTGHHFIRTHVNIIVPIQIETEPSK